MRNGTTSVSPGALFRNKVVGTILLSVLFLQIGIWVRNYAILLHVMEKTNGDAVAVSLISVAEFAPIFLFSIIGGTFADRWRPKRTMVWCDFLSAISIFMVLLTLVFGSWKAIFFATIVSSILSQFSQPSGMKLFKLHVPQQLIQMGMSMYQTIFAVFMILGPIIGTIIYQHYGINVAIIIMGIAFLLSAGVLLFLLEDPVPEQKGEKTSIWKEMKDGLNYVIGNRSLSLLGGCFAVAGFAIGITQPLTIFLVTEQLGLPKEQLQLLMAAFGVGMIVGGGFVMGISRKVSPLMLLMMGMAASGIGYVVLGNSTNLWLTLATQFLVGLFMPFIHIGTNTLILQSTSADFVGRVNGILTPLFMGAMVITMSIAGWIKELFSLAILFEIAAVLFVIGIVIMVPLLKQKVHEEEKI
ncbi:MAG TPA: MFS transporter [Paenibacillaceae bacterium]|nr:MFS transporter [Paenibacillaceae bacterium]